MLSILGRLNDCAMEQRGAPRAAHDWRAGHRWFGAARFVARRGQPGNPELAQSDHHDLHVRRAAASRHVRHQGRRAGANPRRVSADRDQCSRHRDLRASAAPGGDHGQARADPHHGRLDHGRPRFAYLLHRPADDDARPRRLALDRLDPFESAGLEGRRGIPLLRRAKPKAGHPPYGLPGLALLLAPRIGPLRRTARACPI